VVLKNGFRAMPWVDPNSWHFSASQRMMSMTGHFEDFNSEIFKSQCIDILEIPFL